MLWMSPSHSASARSLLVLNTFYLLASSGFVGVIAKANPLADQLLSRFPLLANLDAVFGDHLQQNG